MPVVDINGVEVCYTGSEIRQFFPDRNCLGLAYSRDDRFIDTATQVTVSYNYATDFAGRCDDDAVECSTLVQPPPIVPIPTLPEEIRDQVNNLVRMVTELGDLVSALTLIVKGEIQDSLDGLIAALEDPITGLKKLLTDGLESLEKAIGPIAKSIIDNLIPAVENVGRRVSDQGAAIVGAIAEQTSDIVGGISDALSGLVKALKDGLESVAEKVGAIADSVLQGIKDTLEAIVPSLLDALIENTASLSLFFTTLLERLPSTQELLDTIVQFFMDNWERVSGAVGSFFTQIGGPLIIDALSKLSNFIADQYNAVIDWLINLPFLHESVRTLMRSIRSSLGILSVIPLLGVIVAAVSAAVTGALGAIIETGRQQGMVVTRPTLPAVPDVVQAWRRGMPQGNRLLEVGARFGLQDEWTEMMRSLSKRFLLPDEYIRLWLRDEITDSQLQESLFKIGFDEAELNQLETLAFILPQVPDLVRMLVREVFDPVQRAALTLDAEYPAAATPLFKKLGISEPLAKDYWAAHWELPSPSMGYTMLHRRLITPDDLDALLKALDFAPVWRDLLAAISFRPYNRIDVRRMRKVDVLDRAEVKEAYLDLGYDEEKSENLAEFVERISVEEVKAVKDETRRPLRNLILGGVRSGRISEQDARVALERIGIDPVTIKLALTEIDLQRSVDLADDIRAAIRRRYVSGDWLRERAAESLTEHGFDVTEQGRLFEVWDLQRSLREPTEVERKERDLTRGDIIGAFRDQIIEGDIAAGMLFSLGYDNGEIDIMLTRAILQRQREVVNAERARVRSLYLAGQLDRSDAITALDALAMSPRHRSALIARWDIERDTRSPEIPTGTLERMFKAEIITPAFAGQELLGHGYSPSQIAAYLTLWGLEIPGLARLIEIEIKTRGQIVRLTPVLAEVQT